MSQHEEQNGGSQPQLLDTDRLGVAVVTPRECTAHMGRRASPLISPSARITRYATASGDPVSLAYESISRRPFSNPRTTTPLRYESPLDVNVFRRDGLLSEPMSQEGQRISLRPLAGAAIGAALPARNIPVETELIHYAHRSFALGNSQKQRPSHRKARRWNNDNFVGIASALAKSSERGPAVAEVLLMAQADAHKYRDVYNPHDCPQSAMSKLSEHGELAEIRDQFFKGEIGHETAKPQPSGRKEVDETCVTPAIMMHRINDRLRRIVVRACCNSEKSVEMINIFEQFLMSCFVKTKTTTSLKLVDTLLETPTITKLTTGQTIVRFYFDSESSSGGFHRLLLHAVCQFHALTAVSTTVGLNDTTKSRLLTITGTSFSGRNIRLVDHATETLEQGLELTSGIFSMGVQTNALKV